MTTVCGGPCRGSPIRLEIWPFTSRAAFSILIGAVLGHTGYVRDRDAEFSRRAGARSEVIAELDRALAVVRAVLPQLSEASLAAEFPEPVLGVRFHTSRFLLHLCAHAAFHLGQAGYLRRAMTETRRRAARFRSVRWDDADEARRFKRLMCTSG